MQRRSSTEEVRFRWPRYWLPREHEEKSWGGPFLYDPEDQYGYIFSEHAKRLDQLADKPLLLLLGEPDAGKSTAVRESPDYSDTIPKRRLVIELKDYDTRPELLQALRSASVLPEIDEIVLDGADESRIGSTLVPTIGDWLRNDLPDGIRVRIAMRTSTLTPLFEEQLASAASEIGGALEIWVLAPLREKDMEEAANVLGFEFEAFRSEIYRVGAEHFAVLAGRLAGMAKTYARSNPKRLAETLWEMHEEEIRASVDSKRAAIGPPFNRSEINLTDTVRLLGRIAAVSLFAGKSILWNDRYTDAPLDSLNGGDLSDPSSEEDWGDGIKASELAIARALHVGPFRPGRSTGEITWTQRPVAEFLAAKYLHDRKTPLAQIRQLLIDTESGRIPPQLHGLAAKLCSKPGASEDVVRMVAERDPHVSIRGDLPNMPPEVRQYVAERLLGLASARELSYAEFSVGGLLYRLANPQLAETLLPLIAEQSADEFVREIAVDMAGECCVEVLSTDLAAAALSANEAPRVRSAAARALLRSDRDEDRILMLSAIDGDDASAPAQDVKAYALRALWSKGLISLSKVLSSLGDISTNPRHPYESFLYDFLETVPDEGVVELLNWALSLSPDQLNHASTEFVNGLFKRAFLMSENLKVCEALVPPMLRFADWSSRNGGWGWLRENDLSFNVRFALAAALWRGHEVLSDHDSVDSWRVSEMVTGERGLLRSSDLISLLDPATVFEGDRALAFAFARSVGHFLYLDPDQDLVRIVLNRKGSSPEFDNAFGFLWLPWDLGSKGVQMAREQYNERVLRERDLSKLRRRKGVPAPRPKCRKLLAAFERGDRNSYWLLMDWLNFDDLGWGVANAAYRDIREMPGWKEEGEGFRSRLVAASAKYLSEGCDCPEEWIGRRKIYPPDAAAYRAVRLLRSECLEPDNETYRRWSVAVAAFPAFASDREHERVVAKAVYADPERAEAAMLRCFDADAKANGYASLGSYGRQRLGGTFGDRLVHLAADWPQQARLRLLEEALQAGSQSARAAALNEFLSSADLDSSVALASLIAVRGGMEEWEALKARIERDDTFGRQFIFDLAGRHIHWKSESVSHIGLPLREWLFRWIEDRYPSEDREQGRDIQSFQSALLNSIWVEGNPSSVASVERLRGAYPTLPDMEGLVLHARLRLVEEGWSWLSPSDLRSLLRDPKRSLVRSDSDLQNAVLRSLEDFDAHLRRTGTSWALWDEGENPHPKLEERFSDFACEWLRQDLGRIAVAPNREVQPRRGERWDILVEVRSTGLSKEVSAAIVVEAKLATNERYIWTGMEEQLVNRYMGNSGLRRGIYLIGYVYGAKFAEPKRRRPKPNGLGEWKIYWDAEALRLSTSGRSVRSIVVDLSLP
jgi:hypothetical protein